MVRVPPIVIPEGCTEVLLHACCAPCSSAIVEWLTAHGVRPTIYYYNPNIYPREEYEIRKNESKRHAESLGLQWIDGDYDHDRWLQCVSGMEQEPERGRRCLQCFTLRLTAAARKAAYLGIRFFATTLASSRWKSLDQINQAGHTAEEIVNGQPSTLHLPPSTLHLPPSTFHLPPSTLHLPPSTLHLPPSTLHAQVTFWPQNWRKGGLQDRRNQLLKEYGFYNQQYCGCEFSHKNENYSHNLPRTGKDFIISDHVF